MNASQTMAGRQFIAGRRIASGEATLLSLRAVDGEATGHRFYPASCEEAAQAAEAAQEAFAVYSQTTPQQRARFVNAIADELDALGEAFFAIAGQETALPLARLQGERARTSGQLRMFAGVILRGDTFAARIDTALADRQPLPRPDLRQYQQALGPVAVFGASNFPLAFSTAGGDTASALAAGCPVVVKAHPGHGHRRADRRGDCQGGGTARFTRRRIQYDFRDRYRRRIGPSSGDSGRWLYRFVGRR